MTGIMSKKCEVCDVVKIGIEEYLVEAAGMGGGNAIDSRDHYPDGWQLELRLLVNGKHSFASPLKIIHQSGAFTNVIQELEVVRTMKKIYRFE